MMEAKYIAATSATQTAIWLCMLLRKLEVPMPGTMLLLNDKQSANTLTWEYVNHSRVKYINVYHYFIHKHVELGELEVEHISSADNLANILINDIPCDHHRELAVHLGISEIKGECWTCVKSHVLSHVWSHDWSHDWSHVWPHDWSHDLACDQV